MARGISILTIVCLCLMLGTGVKSYAEPVISPALKEKIQKHIEKMKRTKPKKYQAVVERAGGIITDCRSCHVEMKGKKKK